MPKLLHDVLHAPVYLFQMGKVGSSSLRATLTEHLKGNVYHAHTFQSLPLCAQRELSWRRRLHLPVFVICPVRLPVPRNVSAFFQNFKRDTGFETTDRSWATSELVDLFLRYYPHTIPLEWFDRHFRSTFDVDVLGQSFPADLKWKIYRRNSVRVLVFCSDLDHSAQLKIVSDFVGCEIKKWNYDNLAEGKEYGELYRNFCATAQLPEIYLDMFARSYFCQRFWSKDELQLETQRWSRNAPAIG